MIFAITMAFIHVVLMALTGDPDYFITSQVWCAACCVGASIMDKQNK
jgi:hypothetical protein